MDTEKEELAQVIDEARSKWFSTVEHDNTLGDHIAQAVLDHYAKRIVTVEEIHKAIYADGHFDYLYPGDEDLLVEIVQALQLHRPISPEITEGGK